MDSFVKAFSMLGNEVVNNRIIGPVVRDKSEYSLLKKVSIKFRSASLYLQYFWCTANAAIKNKPDVLIFRYAGNQQFFLTIFILSFFYPVVLEINALRTIENPNASLENLSLSSKIRFFIDKLTIWRTSHCFAVSAILKNHLVHYFQVNEAKVSIIENGVDTEKFNMNINGSEVKEKLQLDDYFIIGFVGTFKPWHGFDFLIQMMVGLKSKYPNIKLLAVGDSQERSSYEVRVREEGLVDSVIFTGHVIHSEIPKYISIMDVTIAPHDRNRFTATGGFHCSPLKIFEYMAMGKPTIATPSGQVSEIIQDEVTGLLINSDQIEELKDAVIKLYLDKNYRNLLGTNARKYVENNYTWEINAKKIENICNSLI